MPAREMSPSALAVGLAMRRRHRPGPRLIIFHIATSAARFRAAEARFHTMPIIRGRRCLWLEKGEGLLNEDVMVLKDAAVPGVGKNAQLCIWQSAGEFE
jgi:hypothetical protein